MAVYLFTLHAYRSWNADNPRGYVRQGQGILPTDHRQAGIYDSLATQEPALFSDTHQRVMAWIVADACHRRSWRLHYLSFEPTHVHILVSWLRFQEWPTVSGKLKNLMGLELGKYFSCPGRQWFSEHGSRKRVRTRRHFEQLVKVYLPGHSGLKWCEGEPLPEKPK